MCVFKVGDVLLYDRSLKPPNAGDPPLYDTAQIWLLATDREGYAIVLKGSFHDNAVRSEVSIGGGDDVGMTWRRVAPPDEWPDDVTALVVEIKLLGEPGS